MKELSVQELKEKIENNEIFLLDVRETFEQYQSKIEYENSKLIPLGELSSRLDELKERKNQPIACLCRSGGRSAKACGILEREGFENVANVKGGINQWAKEIDTNLPVY